MATGFAIGFFNLGADAAHIVRSFTLLAAGGWIFTGALFVANSAFNSLGRPVWSTLFNWSRDGVILWPLAIVLSGWFASAGAVYGQALSAVLVGTAAAITGWFYVARLDRLGRGAYLSDKGDPE